jgi:hypothetical protein
MVELYPNDFKGGAKNGGAPSAKLKCLSDLCAKLMKTNKYNIFDVLYKLMKLALVLSMTSASFEQIFSALKYVKSQLSNKMGDQ